MISELVGPMTTRETAILIAAFAGFLYYPRFIAGAVLKVFENTKTHAAIDEWAEKSKKFEELADKRIKHNENNKLQERQSLQDLMGNLKEQISEISGAMDDLRNIANSVEKMVTILEERQTALSQRQDRLEQACANACKGVANGFSHQHQNKHAA